MVDGERLIARDGQKFNSVSWCTGKLNDGSGRWRRNDRKSWVSMKIIGQCAAKLNEGIGRSENHEIMTRWPSTSH